MTLAELESRASEAAVELARTILEQDVADRLWAEQAGPALSQRDTARLLGKSEQAVSQDRRLLRIRNRDGRPVYPVIQFEGRGTVEGLGGVLAALAPATTPLGTLAWLSGHHAGLGARPIDRLRAGAGTEVLTAALRFADVAA